MRTVSSDIASFKHSPIRNMIKKIMKPVKFSLGKRYCLRFKEKEKIEKKKNQMNLPICAFDIPITDLGFCVECLYK